MIKKIFLFLLKKYTKREEDRIEIFKVLHENVAIEYNEQTTFGNLYNAYIEFIMSSELTTRLVKDGDYRNLKLLKSGLNTSYDKSLEYIKKEKLK